MKKLKKKTPIGLDKPDWDIMLAYGIVILLFILQIIVNTIQYRSSF